MAETSPAESPILFGGDFNMRDSPDRFEHFIRLHRLRLVHVHCRERPRDCDVRMSWDGDAPWMDTQDLQLFASGTEVTVSPVRVEAMFDGSEAGPRLSDHHGFRVVYEIAWPVGLRPVAGACRAGLYRHPGESRDVSGEKAPRPHVTGIPAFAGMTE